MPPEHGVGDRGPASARPRKKVDREALHCPLMRIPGMEIAAVRSLIDLGLTEMHHLHGRSPEVLFEEARRLRPDLPEDFLALYRLAVYFAETPQPERAKLHKQHWT